MNTLPDSLTRPDGSVTNYAYDNIFRLSSITNLNSLNQTLTSNSFVYNNANMRTKETVFNNVSAVLGNSTKTYSYNNLNQLTNSGYAYDADGNMTSGYTPDGYAFTAQYDAENRLTSISYTDANNVTHTASFIYSADNMIAKQIIDGVETRFVRDTNFNVLQERDSTNTVTRSYVWDSIAPGGIGGLLELTQNGQQYDYLYDGKGNVSAVIDANQNVVASYAYNPFGRLLAKSGTLDQPYQFSTKYYYPGYGILYYGYRFYNPTCMKWMTRDPSGEDGGLNLYLAMLNNLINIMDELGLNPVDLQKMVEWIDDNANTYSTGQCARYVRLAIEAGGGDTTGHPIYAKDWGTTLQRIGFNPVSAGAKFGDIVVIQPPPNDIAGHIEIYDGSRWVSDFFQRDFWPGPSYRKFKPSYQMYRQPDSTCNN